MRIRTSKLWRYVGRDNRSMRRETQRVNDNTPNPGSREDRKQKGR